MHLGDELDEEPLAALHQGGEPLLQLLEPLRVPPTVVTASMRAGPRYSGRRPSGPSGCREDVSAAGHPSAPGKIS